MRMRMRMRLWIQIWISPYLKPSLCFSIRFCFWGIHQNRFWIRLPKNPFNPSTFRKCPNPENLNLKHNTRSMVNNETRQDLLYRTENFSLWLNCSFSFWPSPSPILRICNFSYNKLLDMIWMQNEVANKGHFVKLTEDSPYFDSLWWCTTHIVHP